MTSEASPTPMKLHQSLNVIRGTISPSRFDTTAPNDAATGIQHVSHVVEVLSVIEAQRSPSANPVMIGLPPRLSMVHPGVSRWNSGQKSVRSTPFAATTASDGSFAQSYSPR